MRRTLRLLVAASLRGAPALRRLANDTANATAGGASSPPATNATANATGASGTAAGLPAGCSPLAKGGVSASAGFFSLDGTQFMAVPQGAPAPVTGIFCLSKPIQSVVPTALTANHSSANASAHLKGSTVYRPPKYAPSLIVRQLHGYYHHGGAKDFAPDERAYQMALIGFFALPLAVGLLLVLGLSLMQCIVCIRPTCCCCSCCVPKSRNWARRGPRFFVLCGLVLAAAVLMGCWKGRNDFQGAAKTLKLILVNPRLNETGQTPGLADTIGSLDKHAKELDTSAKSIVSSVTALVATGCPDPVPPAGGYAASLAGQMAKKGDETGKQVVTGLKSQLAGSAGQFGEAGKMLKGMFGGMAPLMKKATEMPIERFVDIGLASTMSTVLVVLAVGTLGMLCGCTCCVSMASGQGIAALMALMVVISLEIFVSVLLSDYCVAGPLPSINVLLSKYMAGEESKMPRELGLYFTTCNGTNPVLAPLSGGMQGVDALLTKLTGLAQYKYSSGTPWCKPQLVQPLINAANGTLMAMKAITRDMGCDKINPVLVDLTHKLLCRDVVNGMYHLWVVQAAAAAVFFIDVLLLWKVAYCVRRPKLFPTDGPWPPKAAVAEESGRVGGRKQSVAALALAKLEREARDGSDGSDDGPPPEKAGGSPGKAGGGEGGARRDSWSARQQGAAYAHYEHVFATTRSTARAAKAGSDSDSVSDDGSGGSDSSFELTMHASQLTGYESPDEVIF